jgi:hypothetical protein
MRAKRNLTIAMAALLLAGAAGSTALLAADGYDQQQWWNPGDWFDRNPQYNLFSDRYWNNYQANNPGQANGSDSYDWHSDYNYGSSDHRNDSDYSYSDTWDDDSNYSQNDIWNDDDAGVGTSGKYDSGNDSNRDD